MGRMPLFLVSSISPPTLKAKGKLKVGSHAWCSFYKVIIHDRVALCGDADI